MTFDEAIKLIHNGNCLLFTGAGFSIGAENYRQNNCEFRAAKVIAKELYNLCDVSIDEQDNDLSRASLWYKELFGAHNIIEYLSTEFIVKKITPTQSEYGKYNWRRLYIEL